MATKTAYPKATADQFEAGQWYKTPEEKARAVNAVVAFLKGGMQPEKLTKQVYTFFTGPLSMSAEYDRHGFAYHWFTSDPAKRDFLSEVRRRVHSYAGLDADRCADMARLFTDWQEYDRETGEWVETGVYADLLEDATHGL